MRVSKSLLSEPLTAYLDNTFIREHDVLQRLREETSRMENAGMQLAADQGQLLAMLVRLVGARQALEIGVFTGYSSTVVAMALPDDGRLIACDVSDEYTKVARRYWEDAGVAHKVHLHLGPALETLDLLRTDGFVFDFVFIDADKPNYLAYYEKALGMTRSNGLIALDNTLWSGRVADESAQDEGTNGMRQVNATIAADPRVDSILIPLGDGLTLARKR